MENPESSRKARTGNKRQALILAARALLSEKHFEDVTIPAIAREANVAVGTFYLYFKSKTELLEAISNQFQEDIQVAIQPLLDSNASIRDLIEPILDCVERITLEYQDVLHLIDIEALYFSEISNTVDMVLLLQSRLKQDQMEGKLPSALDPVVTADLLNALVTRMVRGRLRVDSTTRFEMYRSEVIALIHYLLSNR
jgi:AcrR family transcriptional regulator